MKRTVIFTIVVFFLIAGCIHPSEHYVSFNETASQTMPPEDENSTSINESQPEIVPEMKTQEVLEDKKFNADKVFSQATEHNDSRIYVQVYANLSFVSDKEEIAMLVKEYGLSRNGISCSLRSPTNCEVFGIPVNRVGELLQDPRILNITYLPRSEKADQLDVPSMFSEDLYENYHNIYGLPKESVENTYWFKRAKEESLGVYAMIVLYGASTPEEREAFYSRYNLTLDESFCPDEGCEQAKYSEWGYYWIPPSEIIRMLDDNLLRMLHPGHTEYTDYLDEVRTAIKLPRGANHNADVHGKNLLVGMWDGGPEDKVHWHSRRSF